MKNIPFFNGAPNCNLNCMIMALMHLKPWASPNADGKTWSDPFNNSDWLDYFLKQVGLTRRGTGGTGLSSWVVAQCLESHDLSTCLINGAHLGIKKNKLILDSANNYDEAPFVLIACVQYNYLEPDRHSPHAVVITDISPTTVTYHDPGLHAGSHIQKSRQQFEQAQRMCGFSSQNSMGYSNLMVIWDQDHIPDLFKELEHMKQNKSKKRTLNIADEYGRSSFAIYRNPVSVINKILFKR
ncbi:hypothetical protein K1X76_02760 [bacterium]|nr:hypothetical protein [bacterium]